MHQLLVLSHACATGCRIGPWQRNASHKLVSLLQNGQKTSPSSRTGSVRSQIPRSRCSLITVLQVHYELAHELLRRGELSEVASAAELLQRCIETLSNPSMQYEQAKHAVLYVLALFAHGSALCRLEQYGKALNALRECLLLETGQEEEALLTDYDPTTVHATNDTTIYTLEKMATCYENTAQYPQAESVLKLLVQCEQLPRELTGQELSLRLLSLPTTRRSLVNVSKFKFKNNHRRPQTAHA